MTTHPSEVNMALAVAYSACGRLADDARARGDVPGEIAWLEAQREIARAEDAMRVARTKQNWKR